jgi:hypothetical protein
MLPLDLLREVSAYCTVFDSFVLEIALRKPIFPLKDYKKRIYFEPYEHNYNINGRLVNIFTYVSNNVVHSKVLGTLTSLKLNVMSGTSFVLLLVFIS